MNTAPSPGRPLLGCPATVWPALLAVFSLSLVGFAYFSQHHWGMEPCPWCVLQRLIFLCIAAAGLIVTLVRHPFAQWGGLGWMALLADAGMVTAAWQHFVASASSSCKLTLADRILNALGLPEMWPNLFEPRASCADAAVRMLGLPYEVWSGAAFFLIATVSALLIVRRIENRRPPGLNPPAR